MSILGDRHRDTLQARSMLGILYLHLGRLAEAERCFGEAYRTRRLVLGDQNPMTVTSQGHLAFVYLLQGRRADAEPLLCEFRESVSRQQDRLPPFTFWRLRGVGLALLRARDFTRAESFLRLYLELATKKLPDDWLRSSATAALGASLLAQKKYAEAEPLMVSGFEGMQKSGGDPQYVRRAAERVVKLYQDWGRADKAVEWRAQLKALGGA